MAAARTAVGWIVAVAVLALAPGPARGEPVRASLGLAGEYSTLIDALVPLHWDLGLPPFQPWGARPALSVCLPARPWCAAADGSVYPFGGFAAQARAGIGLDARGRRWSGIETLSAGHAWFTESTLVPVYSGRSRTWLFTVASTVRYERTRPWRPAVIASVDMYPWASVLAPRPGFDLRLALGMDVAL